MPFFLTAILTYLCLLMIFSRGEDSFDCTGYEDDSFHPIYDADDCRHYWHCIYVDTVYMHAVRRVCPSGTEFDPILRQCETSSLVDCIPPKSPHGPRTTTTTRAWKWRYSRLFSRKRWKTSTPSFYTTRRHPAFDLEDPPEIETTTMNIIDEEPTTESFRVLPLTQPPITLPPFSLEQLSNNLHALALSSRLNKHKPIVNFFQPGDPHNEVGLYVTTPRPPSPPSPQRTRRTTRRTAFEMTTQMPWTTHPVMTHEMFNTNADVALTSLSPMEMTTIETAMTQTTTTTTTMIMMTTLATTVLPAVASAIPESDTTMNFLAKARFINGQRRRKNMTLFILSSDDHKIRQFSLNHTRGILINCEQLRRRLLGRQLRDILVTNNDHSVLARQTSESLIPRSSTVLLVWTLFASFFLMKIR